MAVDDRFDMTFTLKAVLERSGFSLDVFNDPTMALSNFKADYYDLLPLNVKMPQMNGFELYQQIKKKDDRVKACFVTAYELYYESLALAWLKAFGILSITLHSHLLYNEDKSWGLE